VSKQNELPDEQTDYQPDFELPNRDVVREDNWETYSAKGFVYVPEGVNLAQSMFGVPNVLTGDEYDFDAERPLRHKPRSGIGVYVSPEGIKYFEAHKDEFHRRDPQEPPPVDPEAS
jgi:hypothetical protein